MPGNFRFTPRNNGDHIDIRETFSLSIKSKHSSGCGPLAVKDGGFFQEIESLVFFEISLIAGPNSSKGRMKSTKLNSGSINYN